jgi:hypothetical protein
LEAAWKTLVFRLLLSGIYFFFSGTEKTLENIRVDAPFEGSVEGVRIGDPVSGILSRLASHTPRRGTSVTTRLLPTASTAASCASISTKRARSRRSSSSRTGKRAVPSAGISSLSL